MIASVTSCPSPVSCPLLLSLLATSFLFQSRPLLPLTPVQPQLQPLPPPFSHPQHVCLAGNAAAAAGQFSILDVRPQIGTRPVGKHFDSFYRGYFVGEMESALLQVKRDVEAEEPAVFNSRAPKSGECAYLKSEDKRLLGFFLVISKIISHGIHYAAASFVRLKLDYV